jgi:hypothetical protein
MNDNLGSMAACTFIFIIHQCHGGRPPGISRAVTDNALNARNRAGSHRAGDRAPLRARGSGSAAADGRGLAGGRALEGVFPPVANTSRRFSRPLTVCGAALLRRRHALLPLARRSGRRRSRVARSADYAARFTLAFARDAHRADQTLRLFKYYELTRITVRELSPDLVAEERAGDPG